MWVYLIMLVCMFIYVYIYIYVHMLVWCLQRNNRMLFLFTATEWLKKSLYVGWLVVRVKKNWNMNIVLTGRTFTGSIPLSSLFFPLLVFHHLLHFIFSFFPFMWKLKKECGWNNLHLSTWNRTPLHYQHNTSAHMSTFSLSCKSTKLFFAN